jgi:hypothetical protein
MFGKVRYLVGRDIFDRFEGIYGAVFWVKERVERDF